MPTHPARRLVNVFSNAALMLVTVPSRLPGGRVMVKYQISDNITAWSGIIGVPGNNHRIRKSPDPFAELTPFVQLMILTAVVHVGEYLIVHLNSRPLVVTLRKKLYHLPPQSLVCFLANQIRPAVCIQRLNDRIEYFKRRSLQIDCLLVVVVVYAVGLKISREQMLPAEIIKSKLFFSNKCAW